MEKLVSSIALILSALLVGYGMQKAQRRGLIKLPLELDELRKVLQKIGLLFFMPISFLGAVWIVNLEDMRVVFLPVVGVIALLSGGILGFAFAKLLRLPAKQIGVFYCCGSFTNIGAIGGLVCFMFLGEMGFALVALYKMFEEMTYYTIGFPIARYYGGNDSVSGNVFQRIWGVLRDPFVATILFAFFGGVLLNLMQVSRPLFMETVTGLSVPLGTFVLIVSIGLGMQFTRVSAHFSKCMLISLIKFVCIPVIACSVAYGFGLHQVADGVPFKVVIILSSMPVAFNALVAASIFELDLDLANSLWLVTTGMLIFVLPYLYFITVNL